MFLIVLEKMLEMFIILIVGIITFKTGIIDENSNKKLSNLLLMIVSPLLIVTSYQLEFDNELLHGLILALIVSIITYIVTIFISKPLISKKNVNYSVEKVAALYSNCGFIGIPLINGILGSEGVFYMTAYMTVFNILVWTHGILVMEKNASIKNAWRNLITPAVIAVFIGLLLFLFRIQLPQIIYSPVDMIASMNTPLAMIVAGYNIAQSNLINSLKKIRIYYVCFLKLILFPIICIPILMLIPISFEILFTVWIGVACPTGATVIMFAERHEKDALYASEIFVISTVLSMVSIPLLSIIASNLLK